MRSITGEVLEVGVDWITATGFSSESQVSMQDFGSRLILQEGARGNDCRPWRFAGYEGFVCGSVQLGSRPDSTCVRLGAHVAAAHWEVLYIIADQVSRCDYQVTIRTQSRAIDAIGVVHRQALRHSAKLANGPCVTLIRSNDESATVYLGKRTSDVFGRAYLKGAQSGLLEFENTVRFEVEFKAEHCAQALRAIRSKRPTIAAIAGVVQGFFRSRGVNLEVPATEEYNICCHRTRSTNERRLEWLRTQVGPSVRLLVDAGWYHQVVEALGLRLNQETPGRVSMQLDQHPTGGD